MLSKMEEMRQKVSNGEEVPRPSDWGGYRVIPKWWEYWQGQKSRFHDRYQYEMDGDSWKISQLAP